ncbi:hypothetical protein [Bradyrhizobium sp. ORS 375]|uniref:hypothetical protein n=1 Tax=Bradyrhizobium sp. (strain ORS 375) TaxID=566679 RepID=UPI0015853D68|nr:hypothetical protein [Bradyrhizobium sp. ORS 375]
MEAALPPGECNYFFLAAFLVFFAAFLVAFAAFFAFFAMESSSGVDGLQRDFEAFAGAGQLCISLGCRSQQIREALPFAVTSVLTLIHSSLHSGQRARFARAVRAGLTPGK